MASQADAINNERNTRVQQLNPYDHQDGARMHSLDHTLAR
jgi:hypothetical protein